MRKPEESIARERMKKHENTLTEKHPDTKSNPGRRRQFENKISINQDTEYREVWHEWCLMSRRRKDIMEHSFLVWLEQHERLNKDTTPMTNLVKR